MTTETDTLRERAMLVHLRISSWDANKTDREVSRKVEAEAGAKPNVGRYHKRLLHWMELDEVTNLFIALRRHHYMMTLPWLDGNVRVLTTDAFLDHTRAIGAAKEKLDTILNSLTDVGYDEALEDAKIRLGRLFRQSDYPSLADLRSKFKIKTVYTEIPDGQDFRVKLPDEMKKELAKDIEQQMRELSQQAMDEAWKRLYDSIVAFRDKLADEDKVIKERTMEKLEEMAEILPKLNIAKDPRLDKLADEVRMSIASAKAAEVRENPELREDLVKKSDAVLKKIRGHGKAPKKI